MVGVYERVKLLYDAHRAAPSPVVLWTMGPLTSAYPKKLWRAFHFVTCAMASALARLSQAQSYGEPIGRQRNDPAATGTPGGRAADRIP